LIFIIVTRSQQGDSLNGRFSWAAPTQKRTAAVAKLPSIVANDSPVMENHLYIGANDASKYSFDIASRMMADP